MDNDIMVQPIKPSDISNKPKEIEETSKRNYNRFKNEVITDINNCIEKHNWYESGSPTVEIPYSTKHLYGITNKGVHKCYLELIDLYTKAGWHVFSSTGAQKMYYFTLSIDKKRNENSESTNY